MSDELEMARESFAVAYVTGTFSLSPIAMSSDKLKKKAVCATALLYDYFLTVSDEIRRMWRYVVLPMLVFTGIGKCIATVKNISAYTTTLIASTRNDLSPSLSVFPIYFLRWLVVCITVTNTCVEDKDNKVTAFPYVLIAGVITSSGLTIKDYRGEAVNIVEDFNALPGCYAASVPPIIAGYWIASTIIESTFFALVIWRVITWSRDNSGVPPALILMARDSTLYFSVIFVLLIVNLFVFKYAPPFLSSLFVTPANTAGCIAGARMMMNLRGMSDTGMTNTELEMTHFTDVRFNSVWEGKGKKPETGTTTTGMTTTSGWTETTHSGPLEVTTISPAPVSATVTFARDACDDDQRMVAEAV
ncbi:hypothetical protein DFH11DRAFT_1789653 [Phellopilus nigrolimitatus]|nr:hypothetical protein DFH11DRAFT_1789653 [Phellopilus nigrolimitatus]